VKFQSRDETCGPAALQNACRALGLRIGQERVARLCGTSCDGTDEAGILTGIDALGLGREELRSRDVREARAWLHEQLRAGRPVLLCVDEWQHWVALVGLLGGNSGWRTVLVDSAVNAYNRAENGVHLVDARRLIRRWRASRRTAGHEPPFYAVALRPRPAAGRSRLAEPTSTGAPGLH
jgi:ABC-type bacteriocin/lantibiotic exporter with double-glycine peptidase domain